MANIAMSCSGCVSTVIGRPMARIRMLLVEAIAVRCQPSEELECDPKVEFEIRLRETVLWNRTTTATRISFFEEVHVSCNYATPNAHMETNCAVGLNHVVHAGRLVVARPCGNRKSIL